MRYCIDREVNLNNGAGYDIALYTLIGDFDKALDIARFILHEYIDERFKEQREFNELIDNHNKLGFIFYDKGVSIRIKNEFVNFNQST